MYLAIAKSETLQHVLNFFFAKQFDNDIGKLMNILKVQNACVFEYSLGLFVDQQLVVIYPENADCVVLILCFVMEKRVFLPNFVT
jgi:hypothetical protein